MSMMYLMKLESFIKRPYVIILEYKKGDFVLVNGYGYAKILAVDNCDYKNKTGIKGIENKPYLCRFKDGQNIWISKELVYRRLTDEEIKDFTIEMDAQKYNL